MGFPVIAFSGLSFLCLFITIATFLINSIGFVIKGGTFFLFGGKTCKYLTIALIPCSSYIRTKSTKYYLRKSCIKYCYLKFTSLVKCICSSGGGELSAPSVK